jgi:hypothetical protein
MLIEPTGACVSVAFALALGGGVGVGGVVGVGLGTCVGVGIVVGATVALVVLVGDTVGALVAVGITVALGSGVGACVAVETGVGIAVGVVVATIIVVADGVGTDMVDVTTSAGGVANGLLTVGAPNAGATSRRTSDAPSTIPTTIARVVIGIGGRWPGDVIMPLPSLHTCSSRAIHDLAVQLATYMPPRHAKSCLQTLSARAIHILYCLGANAYPVSAAIRPEKSPRIVDA